MKDSRTFDLFPGWSAPAGPPRDTCLDSLPGALLGRGGGGPCASPALGGGVGARGVAGGGSPLHRGVRRSRRRPGEHLDPRVSRGSGDVHANGLGHARRGHDGRGHADAGMTDAGSADSGPSTAPPDGGTGDGGTSSPDGGSADGGSVDAGSPDAGTGPDGGVPSCRPMPEPPVASCDTLMPTQPLDPPRRFLGPTPSSPDDPLCDPGAFSGTGRPPRRDADARRGSEREGEQARARPPLARRDPAPQSTGGHHHLLLHGAAAGGSGSHPCRRRRPGTLVRIDRTGATSELAVGMARSAAAMPGGGTVVAEGGTSTRWTEALTAPLRITRRDDAARRSGRRRSPPRSRRILPMRRSIPTGWDTCSRWWRSTNSRNASCGSTRRARS